MTKPRRIVTGHDEAGRSIVLVDAPDAPAHEVGGAGGHVFHELWTTAETPAPIDHDTGAADEPACRLLPPDGGTRLRIVEMPPDQPGREPPPSALIAALFAEMGAPDAYRPGERHPLMHRTETIDYAIVLDGEVTLVLDRTETVVKAGDVVVQRGTAHAWENRSGRTCRVAFVMVDGNFAPDLR